MSVSLSDFKKIEIKIAKILEAEEIPGADRLWKLAIDAGAGRKQIVAGIKNFYSKDSLVGKSIVVVDNLEPAVIRGIESQGMLLAAKDANGLSLIVPDKDASPGSVVG